MILIIRYPAIWRARIRCAAQVVLSFVALWLGAIAFLSF